MIKQIQMFASLKLTAIDPTEDHPRFTQAIRARDQHARSRVLTHLLPGPKVDLLVPILTFVGLNTEEWMRTRKISWNDAITAADAIEQNLPQLSASENLGKWWLGIAKEWRFSGGLRLAGLKKSDGVTIPVRNPKEEPK